MTYFALTHPSFEMRFSKTGKDVEYKVPYLEDTKNKLWKYNKKLGKVWLVLGKRFVYHRLGAGGGGSRDMGTKG